MSGLDHDEAASLLADYVDNLLADSRADLVDAHLRDCAQCRSQLAILHALDLRDRYEALANTPHTHRPDAPVVPLSPPRASWSGAALIGRGRELALVAAAMLAVGIGAGRWVWGGGDEGVAAPPEGLVPLGMPHDRVEPSSTAPPMRLYERVAGADILSDGQISAGSDLVVETSGATPFGVVGDDVVRLYPMHGGWLWPRPPLDEGDGLVVVVAGADPAFDPDVLLQPDWEARLARDGISFSSHGVTRKGRAN